MMYHAPSGSLIVPTDALKRGASQFLWALKKIREAAGLPLDRYEREPGPLQAADFAQIAVIEGALDLGINLGVTPHDYHKLDLRSEG